MIVKRGSPNIFIKKQYENFVGKVKCECQLLLHDGK